MHLPLNIMYKTFVKCSGTIIYKIVHTKSNLFNNLNLTILMSENLLFCNSLHEQRWTNNGQGTFCGQIKMTSNCRISTQHIPRVIHYILLHSHELTSQCGMIIRVVVGSLLLKHRSIAGPVIYIVTAASLEWMLRRFVRPVL